MQTFRFEEHVVTTLTSNTDITADACINPKQMYQEMSGRNGV